MTIRFYFYTNWSKHLFYKHVYMRRRKYISSLGVWMLSLIAGCSTPRNGSNESDENEKNTTKKNMVNDDETIDTDILLSRHKKQTIDKPITITKTVTDHFGSTSVINNIVKTKIGSDAVIHSIKSSSNQNQDFWEGDDETHILSKYDDNEPRNYSIPQQINVKYNNIYSNLNEILSIGTYKIKKETDEKYICYSRNDNTTTRPKYEEMELANYDIELRTTKNGRITYLNIRYKSFIPEREYGDGIEHTITTDAVRSITYEIEDIDDTHVEKPSWVTNDSVVINSNKTNTQLEMVNGKEIPKGSMLNISSQSLDETFSVRQKINTGDVVYIFEQDGNIDYSINDEPNSELYNNSVDVDFEVNYTTAYSTNPNTKVNYLTLSPP